MIIQNADFLVIKEWKQEVKKNNNAVVRCIEVGKSKSAYKKIIGSSNKNNRVVQK